MNLQSVAASGATLIMVAFAMTGCGGGGGGDPKNDPIIINPQTTKTLVVPAMGSPGSPSLEVSSGAVGSAPVPANSRIAFRAIGEGRFVYGSKSDSFGRQSDEGVANPSSPITVPAFSASFYELTQGQWKQLTNTNPWLTTPEANLGGSGVIGDSLPAFGLSYDQVIAGITSFNARSSIKVRLLTNVEWEFACRAGTPGLYSWGGDWGDDASPSTVSRYAVVRESAAGVPGARSVGRTRADGSYEFFRLPNAMGLYDMHGNLWEWVDAGSGIDGRTLRGGSWVDNLVSARSANLQYVPGNIPYGTSGIRLALQ